MTEYKLLTDDELKLAELYKAKKIMVKNRDQARINKAMSTLAARNCNSLIIDMETDIQKLEDDKVVCPEIPENEPEPINIHTPT